jgi:hypothetical protein
VSNLKLESSSDMELFMELQGKNRVLGRQSRALLPAGSRLLLGLAHLLAFRRIHGCALIISSIDCRFFAMGLNIAGQSNGSNSDIWRV